MVLLTVWAKNKNAEGRMEQGTWGTRNAALAGW
jgi:hypothetical protein